MIFNKADFIASYGISSQLPESDRPELSFRGAPTWANPA